MEEAVAPEGEQEYLEKTVSAESSGKVKSRAKTSTAAGLFQFEDDTFVALVEKHRPEIAGDMDREEILALRTEDSVEAKALQFAMARELTREHVAHMEKKGIETTDPNKYALHFLGQPQGTKVLLHEDQEALIRDIIPESFINANKNVRLGGKKFADWTVADFKAWTEKKMED